MNSKIAYTLCPFPHLDAYGKLENGLYYEHPKQCRKCQGIHCSEYLEQSIESGQVYHRVCCSGLSVFIILFPKFQMIINGVLEAEINNACPSPTRKSLRKNKVRKKDIDDWLSSLNEIFTLLNSAMETKVRETIGTLHDVRTAVNLVYRNAEALVQREQGISFDEKVENTAPELKSLLKSVGLLTTRFTASSIVANPESVRHGTKRSCGVYKIFHKMCRLFQEVANRKNVNIKIEGTSFKTPAVYDSIEALAMVLLDNAVKYSEPGKEVIVSVNDEDDGVHVKIESCGHTVPDDEQERIFEKGHRTSKAEEKVRDGSGLGLYIAKLITDAHEARISYKSRNVGTNGIGRNIISLTIFDTRK